MINYNPPTLGERNLVNFGPLTKKVLGTHVDARKINTARAVRANAIAFGPRDTAESGISTSQIASPVGLRAPGAPHVGLCPKFLARLFYAQNSFTQLHRQRRYPDSIRAPHSAGLRSPGAKFRRSLKISERRRAARGNRRG